jgi:Menin.
LCNIADLEEIEPTDQKLTIIELYEKAISINIKQYGGRQVYPFTYYAGFSFRTQQYRKALELWKQGARAVSRY